MTDPHRPQVLAPKTDGSFDVPPRDLLNELIDAAIRFIKDYEDEQFLEIGCSLGIVASSVVESKACT